MEMRTLRIRAVPDHHCIRRKTNRQPCRQSALESGVGDVADSAGSFDLRIGDAVSLYFSHDHFFGVQRRDVKRLACGFEQSDSFVIEILVKVD